MDLPPLIVKQRTNKKRIKPDNTKEVVDGVKIEKNIRIEEPLALVPKKEREKKVIWKPFEGPQTQFLAADEDEVLFSGGRGSGKSDAFLVDPLRYVNDPSFRGLILRRTMPALKDLIRGAKELYFQAFPTCKWKEQEKMFVFPSGASIDFGYLDSIDDCERYHGQEYSWLGIDEISQFPDISWYYKLKGSIRSTKLRTKIRATSNPTGVGRNWVKEYWIDQGEANTTITEKVESPFGELKITKKWLHSTVRDNPALMNSPQYLAVLSTYPEPLRSAWLDGSWDAIEGMAFPEFSKKLHVIDPFKIPTNWVKFRGCDWGYASPAVCLWLAIDYDNNIYVYRELAVNGDISRQLGQEPLTAGPFARKVLELEQGEFVKWGVLDCSTWAKKGDEGPSIAEAMEMERCFWRQSDRSAKQREAGKLEIHRLLKIDEVTKKPKIFIFNTCKELIKELASLPIDETNPEDVDTKARDHCFHKDTEILTNTGWKNIQNVSVGEQVISLDVNNTIEYQPIIDTTKVFKENIQNYRSTALDFSVTDNHKLCVLTQYKYKKTKNRNWDLVELKDCKSSMHIPRSGIWEGNSTDIQIGEHSISEKDFLAFLGIWLSEGCSGIVKSHYRIIVDQKKFVKEVRNILAKLPFHFSEHTNKDGCTRFTANSKLFYEYLSTLGLIGKKSHEKFIPRKFLNSSFASLKAMFNALMLGDGCWQDTGSHYDTTSKQLSDDFQELCLKVGYVGSIKKYSNRITNKTINGRDTYRIYLRNKGNNYINFFAKHIKEEKYNDYAYCVTVPKNHTVFTRFNGKPMWIGQSYDALRYAIMSRPHVALGWDDLFKLQREKPIVVDETFGY